jgi:hypothetical protein
MLPRDRLIYPATMESACVEVAALAADPGGPSAQ